MIPFSDRLRFLRERMGLNQQQAAIRLNMKPVTYSSYENGHIPKLETIIKLSQFYNVSIDYLTGVTNERRPMGNKLQDGLATLSQFADQESPTSEDLVEFFNSIIRYYQEGAPCGALPLNSWVGFTKAMTDCMAAISDNDITAMLYHANNAVIASLDITKIPALVLTNKETSHK